MAALCSGCLGFVNVLSSNQFFGFEKNKGAITVEFSFIMLFVIAFFFAIVSYGIGLTAQQIIAYQATRQAEKAVVVSHENLSENACEAYEERIRTYINDLPLNSGFPLQFAPIKSRAVSVRNNDGGQGSYVTVELRAGYNLVSAQPFTVFFPLLDEIVVVGVAQLPYKVGSPGPNCS